ncbi:MAG: hypothetical protein JSR78_20390 [Proteobacteria bacterium]|nr:hypothetical protein [Pseudomonadota bacterium]
MTAPANGSGPSNHPLLRLMLMGLLSGIISAFIAAFALVILAEHGTFTKASTEAAIKNFGDDMPTTLLAAFIWFLPVGIFVFPPAAKFLGAASGAGTLRLLKLVALAAGLWCLLAEVIYLVPLPLAPGPPGAQSADMSRAALSGVFFAVVYDLLLRRRDYLLDRKPR